MMPTRPLTRSDAWILTALCEGRGDRLMPVRDLLYAGDWLNHAIVSFDELSFGLPRLQSAGLVEVRRGTDGLLVRATDGGRALRKSVDAGTLGGLLSEMADAVGAPPYPTPEAEDRSLGRLAGFTEAQWRADVAAYRRAFRADAGKVVAAGALAVGGVVGGVLYWWRRRA